MSIYSLSVAKRRFKNRKCNTLIFFFTFSQINLPTKGYFFSCDKTLKTNNRLVNNFSTVVEINNFIRRQKNKYVN